MQYDPFSPLVRHLPVALRHSCSSLERSTLLSPAGITTQGLSLTVVAVFIDRFRASDERMRSKMTLTIPARRGVKVAMSTAVSQMFLDTRIFSSVLMIASVLSNRVSGYVDMVAFFPRATTLSPMLAIQYVLIRWLRLCAKEAGVVFEVLCALKYTLKGKPRSAKKVVSGQFPEEPPSTVLHAQTPHEFVQGGRVCIESTSRLLMVQPW